MGERKVIVEFIRPRQGMGRIKGMEARTSREAPAMASRKAPAMELRAMILWKLR